MTPQHVRVRALDRARRPVRGGLVVVAGVCLLAFLTGALTALLAAWVG